MWIVPLYWYFELYLSITKRRGGKLERGGFLPPSFPTPTLSLAVFSSSLFFTPPPLSECLEQAILALDNSSVTARKNDTKTMTVSFKGAVPRSLYCLPYLKRLKKRMTNQLISSRFKINAKSLNNYWHASSWNSRVFCPLVKLARLLINWQPWSI